MAVTIEGERRRVRHVRDERFPRPVRPDDENRDGRLLPARSAEGDVEIAVTIEGGIIHLVNARHEGRADVDVGGLPRQLFDPHRRGSPFEIRGNDDGELRGGRVREARSLRPDTHLRQTGVNGKARPLERYAASFNRPQRANGGHTAQLQVSSRRLARRSSRSNRATFPARYEDRS